MLRENPWPHPRNNNGSTHMERFNANATTEITHKKGRVNVRPRPHRLVLSTYFFFFMIEIKENHDRCMFANGWPRKKLRKKGGQKYYYFFFFLREGGEKWRDEGGST